VLDDLHFADDASLELLQWLICAARDAEPDLRPGSRPGRMFWLLAMRPATAESRLHHLIDAVAAAVPHCRLHLKPLTVAQMGALLESLSLQQVGGDALAAALHQRTGGNPLFALETLKLAWVDGSLHQATDLPRPQSLAQLIGQQLGRLSAPALNLVRVAAVAGAAFSVQLAERVLRRSVLDLVDAWQELERGQVLRGTDFAHDLLHDAVLDSLPQPIARHLHAEVAQSLEAQGAEPARIAAHWESAGLVERALPALFNAAARAQAASRTPERIGFLLRAADIAESTGQSNRAFDALQMAVESHMNTLRDAKGFALLDRLERLATTPEQQVLAAGDRAWYHGIVGDWAEAVRAGQHALDLAAGGDVHPALRAVLQQRLGTSLGMLGQFDLALTHLRAAESGAPLYASAEEQAELQGNLAVVMGNLGRVAQAQAHHLREINGPSTLASHSQSATALANYASNRFQAGDVHEAWKQAQLAQQRVDSGNLNGSSAGFVAVQVCQSARVLGRFRDALAAGDQALALVQQSNPALLPPVRVARAQVWFDLGQFARVPQELNAVADWGQVAQRHQVRRLILLARLAEASAGAAGAEEARRLWSEAERSLPTTGWSELGFLLALERCHAQPPPTALAALEAVLTRARESGMRGVELSAHVRLADTALRLGGTGGARRAADHVRCALALSEQACPTLVGRAELWWQAGRALAAVGDPAAPATFELGVRWLNEVAAQHIDTPFQESFLHRVAVHRALLVQRDMGSLVN
jgi:tetratricopeptide (TPR) repeat protein